MSVDMEALTLRKKVVNESGTTVEAPWKKERKKQKSWWSKPL
jgi:hypothetical protein